MLFRDCRRRHQWIALAVIAFLLFTVLLWTAQQGR
jgi:Na+/melibiose symporter-like transporter